MLFSKRCRCNLPDFIYFLAVVLCPTCIFADSIVNQNYLFSGVNIYSPTVIFDAQANLYKMWYGGWQTCSQSGGTACHDQIYYRTSTDAVHWSSSTTVLTPSNIGSNVYHVNDPSVTKTYNQANGQYQYTMFFTACLNPCPNQSYNQLWSVTSGDGIHWVYQQQLITGGNGSAEPTIIVDPQPNGAYWKVYYLNTGSDNVDLWMAEVDGNRNFLNAQIVYTWPNAGAIANPEVRNINGVWNLFFNVYANSADIGKTTSASNTGWSAPVEYLIQNTGPSICATIAPGVFSLTNGQYQMYFGQTPRQTNGSCMLDDQTTMQMWTWQQ